MKVDKEVYDKILRESEKYRVLVSIAKTGICYSDLKEVILAMAEKAEGEA